jgi:hypothetical protein
MSWSVASATAAAPSMSLSTLAVTILGSTVLATLVTTIVTGLRSSSSARRDSYAAAVEAVVAWFEFPYRVRRRTSDAPDTLGALASLGHDVQERLAGRLAWVATDNDVVSETFDAVLAAVRGRVGDSVVEAWNTPAIVAAPDMNVSPFGPGNLQPELVKLHVAIGYRFGVRRMFPHRLVRWRLASRGVLPRP